MPFIISLLDVKQGVIMTENDTTKAQEATPTTPEADRTFTQDDVNRIVGERLSRERERAESEIEAARNGYEADFQQRMAEKEKKFQRKEFVLAAKDTLTKSGYPADLIDMLNVENMDALNACIEKLDAVAKTKAAAPTTLVRVDSGMAHGAPISSGGEHERILAAMKIRE